MDAVDPNSRDFDLTNEEISLAMNEQYSIVNNSIFQVCACAILLLIAPCLTYLSDKLISESLPAVMN